MISYMITNYKIDKALSESRIKADIDKAFEMAQKDGGAFSGWALSRQAITAFVVQLFQESVDTKHIVELGGGQSTLFWNALSQVSDLPLRVDTYEHHPQWAAELSQKTAGSPSVQIHHVGLKQFSDETFQSFFQEGVDPQYASLGRDVSDEDAEFTRIRNCFYDLDIQIFKDASIDGLIVDGPHGNGRSLAYPLFAKKLNDKALVLVDDFDHYPFLEDATKVIDYEVMYRNRYKKRWVLLQTL